MGAVHWFYLQNIIYKTFTSCVYPVNVGVLQSSVFGLWPFLCYVLSLDTPLLEIQLLPEYWWILNFISLSWAPDLYIQFPTRWPHVPDYKMTYSWHVHGQGQRTHGGPYPPPLSFLLPSMVRGFTGSHVCSPQPEFALFSLIPTKKSHFWLLLGLGGIVWWWGSPSGGQAWGRGLSTGCKWAWSHLGDS